MPPTASHARRALKLRPPQAARPCSLVHLRVVDGAVEVVAAAGLAQVGDERGIHDKLLTELVLLGAGRA